MEYTIFDEEVVRKILIPTNKNPVTAHAISYIASLFPKAKYYVLGVVDITGEAALLYTSYSSEHLNVVEKLEKDAVREISDIIKKENAEVVEEKILYGHPANAILSYSKKKGINMIVLATTSKVGMETVKLGNTARRIITATKIPVFLFTPMAQLKPIKNILNPSSFSKYSFRASMLGIAFARHFGSNVKTLSVGKDHSDTIRNNISNYAKQMGVNLEFSTFKTQNPLQETLSLCEQSDIMIASRGRKGISYKFRYFHKEFALGKFEKDVITLSPIPIILVNE